MRYETRRVPMIGIRRVLSLAGIIFYNDIFENFFVTSAFRAETENTFRVPLKLAVTENTFRVLFMHSDFPIISTAGCVNVR